MPQFTDPHSFGWEKFVEQVLCRRIEACVQHKDIYYMWIPLFGIGKIEHFNLL